jgi:hypothetical protein
VLLLHPPNTRGCHWRRLLCLPGPRGYPRRQPVALAPAGTLGGVAATAAAAALATGAHSFLEYNITELAWDIEVFPGQPAVP